MMSHRNSGKATVAGFTIVELIVAIAILAILLATAVPSLQKFIRDNRVTSQTNELIALINLTRNEAVRRGIDANDPDEALLRLDTTVAGWSGNVSVTGGETAEGCPSNVLRCAANQSVDMTTGNVELSFESRGFLTPFAGAAICLRHSDADRCDGTRQHVRIDILPTGQIETLGLECEATCP